jgi:hypothetical protein
VRYFLIAVAIAAALYLGWLARGLHPAYSIFLWPLALAMGLAAIGLMKRQAWAAYLLSVAAFLCVLPIVFLMLFLASSWRTQPATPGSDPAGLILWGALALAVTVGGTGISLGGRLRRERRERRERDAPE